MLKKRILKNSRSSKIKINNYFDNKKVIAFNDIVSPKIYLGLSNSQF